MRTLQQMSVIKGSWEWNGTLGARVRQRLWFSLSETTHSFGIQSANYT